MATNPLLVRWRQSSGAPRRFSLTFSFFLLIGHCQQAVAAIDPELLAQVTVNPLPGPASCYAGTTGADATFFLRDDIHRIDCSIFSGQAPCLARREFDTDGPNGRPVSLEGVVVERPSVTADGVSVYFTKFGFNVCGMQSSALAAEGCFGRDLLGFDPHTITPTPDGSLIAMTALDPNNSFQPANEIIVNSAGTTQTVANYVIATADVGGSQLQLSTMDIPVNLKYIFSDARNPVTGLWAIYAVEASSGQTLVVIPPVTGLHIRNPALAQSSDDFMLFDVQDPVTGETVVFGANLLTGELSQLATSQVLAYPSFTGNDGGFVFTVADLSTESKVSLQLQPLFDNRITKHPSLGATRWLTDGGAGVIYRRGTFNGQLKDPETCGVISGLVDTDGDTLSDEDESTRFNTDPNLTDTDSDGLDDAAELSADTNPLEMDTDGDGASDGDELELGTDPLDANDCPSSICATESSVLRLLLPLQENGTLQAEPDHP